VSRPRKIPEHQAYYDALDWPDKRRVQDHQWDLLQRDAAAGLDFPALACWHIAVDLVRIEGVRPAIPPIEHVRRDDEYFNL
jgi:hypothetical protein